jgi:hypothetical protein
MHQQAAYERLRPTTPVKVYHGTSIYHVQDLINGFDANRVVGRHYGGPKHAGLFVTPKESVASSFGSEIILEMIVQAKNLHGTDWSGNIGRTNPRAVARAEQKYPDSFRPLLSDTLNLSSEPQALLRGLVKPNQIKRVRYKPPGTQTPKWYSRKEFLNLGLEAGRPYGIKKPVRDLGWDLSYPGYSLEEFKEAYKAAEGISPQDDPFEVMEMFLQHGMDDRVVSYMEDAGFGPTAIKSFLYKMKQSLGMNKRAVSCDSLHSTAWISPSGQVFDLAKTGETHREFAGRMMRRQDPGLYQKLKDGLEHGRVREHWTPFHRWLIDRGWIQVFNPTEVTLSKRTPAKAQEVLAGYLIQCILEKGLNPAAVTMRVWRTQGPLEVLPDLSMRGDSPRQERIPVERYIEEWASPQEVDDMWTALLESLG